MLQTTTSFRIVYGCLDSSVAVANTIWLVTSKTFYLGPFTENCWPWYSTAVTLPITPSILILTHSQSRSLHVLWCGWSYCLQNEPLFLYIPFLPSLSHGWVLKQHSAPLYYLVFDSLMSHSRDTNSLSRDFLT